MLRDFVLGSIKIHILHHASQEPVYGMALINELSRHGHQVSPGTLYPVLHGLERAGLLHSQRAVSGGRVRRYYEITPEGRRALHEARHVIRELMHEILAKETTS